MNMLARLLYKKGLVAYPKAPSLTTRRHGYCARGGQQDERGACRHRRQRAWRPLSFIAVWGGSLHLVVAAALALDGLDVAEGGVGDGVQRLPGQEGLVTGEQHVVAG